MNSLSWFLYAADALMGVKVLFVLFGSVSSIAGVISWIAWTICRGGRADMLKFCPKDSERVKSCEAWIEIWSSLRGLLKGGFVLLFIGSVLPTSGTMYAIAASQIGEKIVNSDTVQGMAGDASKALQQWIKRQIDAPEAKK